MCVCVCVCVCVCSHLKLYWQELIMSYMGKMAHRQFSRGTKGLSVTQVELNYTNLLPKHTHTKYLTSITHNTHTHTHTHTHPRTHTHTCTHTHTNTHTHTHTHMHTNT